jgi:hypothetical protein
MRLDRIGENVLFSDFLSSVGLDVRSDVDVFYVSTLRLNLWGN